MISKLTKIRQKSLHLSRKVFGFSSWFYIPNQGMSGFELLSRASCFLVPTQGVNDKLLHVVASAHVTHPFLFKNYYPQDWLNFVTEDDVESRVEIRDPQTGEILLELDVEHRYFRHPFLDLVVCHLRYEDEFLDFAYENDFGILEMQEPNEEVQMNDSISIAGFDIQDPNDEEQKFVTKISVGNVTRIEKSRVFAKTTPTVLMGMCGGCVVNNESNKCVGVLEGLVQQRKNIQIPENLKDAAAYVKGSTLYTFLEDVNYQLQEEENKF